MIGGSIAGMCAAQAIAPHFRRVTLLDRDELPAGPDGRAGVPQGRHIHGLLAGGARALEALFPGFGARMVERGAHRVDLFHDFAVLRPVGWFPRMRSNVPFLSASRGLTEATVRALLRATPNVTTVERTDVTGLAISDGRVTGVTTRRRGGDAGALAADLVIDCSGRSSRALDWLRAADAEVPGEEVVDAFGGYSSRWYQAPPPERWPRSWWWRGISIEPTPEHMIGAVLYPVDGDRWILTLGGYSKHYPPTDEAGFDAALRALRTPLVAEAIALAEPISPVHGHRSFANRFRRYDRLRAPLAGFVALGDSVCAVNPFYGQGMTASALSAHNLAAWLRATAGPIGSAEARRFYRSQAALLDDIWTISTSADFAFPGTAGTRPFGSSVLKRIGDVVADVSRTDPVVLQHLAEVFHVLRPVSSLMAPSLVARVATRAAQRWVTRALGSVRSEPEELRSAARQLLRVEGP